MGEISIEGRFYRRIKAALGLPVVKLNLQGRRAWPDRMVLLPGGFSLFIEFKVPGKAAEPLQAHIHEQLRRLGHRVEVFDNVEEAVDFVVRTARDVDSSNALGAMVREPIDFPQDASDG